MRWTALVQFFEQHAKGSEVKRLFEAPKRGDGEGQAPKEKGEGEGERKGKGKGEGEGARAVDKSKITIGVSRPTPTDTPAHSEGKEGEGGVAGGARVDIDDFTVGLVAAGLNFKDDALLALRKDLMLLVDTESGKLHLVSDRVHDYL